MIRLVLFGALALLATMPSIGIAKLYLKRRNIDPAGSIVQTFMKVAPLPLKLVLITINFVSFAVIAGLAWYGLGLLGA